MTVRPECVCGMQNSTALPPDHALTCPVNPRFDPRRGTSPAELQAYAEEYFRRRVSGLYVCDCQIRGSPAGSHTAECDLALMRHPDRFRRVDAHSKPPRGTQEMAAARKAELDALAFAYGSLCLLRDEQDATAHRAAAITLEALKAWERANQPKAWPP